MYRRVIQKKIEDWLFQKKIIVLFGARQVGKTTLSKEIIRKYGKKGKYINCEFIRNQEMFSHPDPEKIKLFLEDYQIIVLDEAQKINNIGIVLKVLIDTYPDLQIIATGSSSFDLANKASEPLTGRSINMMLFPLSIEEIRQKRDWFEIESVLENILVFGTYPDVFGKSKEKSKDILESIASNYLYKDILKFENLKNPDLLLKILKMLSLQLGSEVSYLELARSLGVSSKTIEKYIDLLEKTFVVFRLNSFSRNIRKEITKSFKVFFWDLGIRNSLINNFNSLDSRNDVGALFENFWIAERIKFTKNHKIPANSYFWRTYDQQEIDYIEESEGRLKAFEIKWNKNKKAKAPKIFLENYPGSSFEVINSDNFYSFLR